MLHNFFQLIEKSATESVSGITLSAKIIINKDHPIFEGHFPNFPIVPGVCMIQMIKEILESHLATRLLLTSSGNIKFLSVINPEKNNELNAEISFIHASDKVDVVAKLFSAEVIFFKINGAFSILL